MRELAQGELEDLEPALEVLTLKSSNCSSPRTWKTPKMPFLEVRAGTGGDEAGLFAGELLRMYIRFLEDKGWTYEPCPPQKAPQAGIRKPASKCAARTCTAPSNTNQAFTACSACPPRNPKAASTPRPRRSPSSPKPTNSTWKFATSTSEKTPFAPGGRGQHVNKTESGVRLTHFPTGIVMECQDGRSQHQNYDRALTVLRARIWDQARAAQDAAVAQQRKTLVSTGTVRRRFGPTISPKDA